MINIREINSSSEDNSSNDDYINEMAKKLSNRPLKEHEKTTT